MTLAQSEAVEVARAATRKLPAPREQVAHVPALDGIRGVAILLVMLHHFTYGATGAAQPARAFVLFCESGWIGVDLFFVLSGFLITNILLDAKHSKHYFRNFYARRTLRIFPLYYGYLFVVCVLIARFTHIDRERSAELLSYESWLWLYGSNILITLRGVFLAASVNHFWTLAIEEHFYLIWPAIVRSVHFERMAHACAAFVVLALASRSGFHFSGFWGMAPMVLTICRIDALALGGLLAVLMRRAGAQALALGARRVLAATAPFAVFFAFGGATLSWGLALLHTAGYTLIGVFFAAFIALTLLSQGSLARVMSQRWLQFFGRYAYGLYVFHHPLRIALQRVLPFEHLGEMLGSYWLGLTLHSSAAGALSVLVALLSYHLYEKQFLRLKRYFAYGGAGA